MTTAIQTRAQRIETLKTLVDTLPTKAMGSVLDRLAELGDLLRRSTALELRDGFVDGQLQLLRAEDVTQAITPELTHSLGATLKQAADEAMESYLSEDPGEQNEWRQSAAQALLLRDRTQSILRALELFAMTDDSATTMYEQLEAALGRIDDALKPKIRYFIPLNDWRRDERDTLNPAERLSSFWFSVRADCDDLLDALQGMKLDSVHFKSCLQCREDLAVPFSPPRHLTSEIAFELDLGLLPKHIADHYRLHAEKCPPCAEVLEAIAAGDRAIEELESQVPPSGKAARRRDEEVLEDAREYRVLLRRREGRVKLLLCPGEGRPLATATVTVPGRKHPIAAYATAEGLEFDLGEEPELQEKRVTLKFKLQSAGPTIEKTYRAS